MKPSGIFCMIVLIPVFIFSQNRYDLVIDEVMADSSPQIGLPNNEWIELKNVSATAINLQGWKIGDASSQSGTFPNFILMPDSFVIVCSVSAVAAMSVFGTTISVSGFPSLDNGGDQLYLKSSGGKIIHAVSYSDNWYQNELKKEGGWTLEMIDSKNPCTGMANWKASVDAKGGTPGKKNSVDAVNHDVVAPQLKNIYCLDSLSIIVNYDEPVDSLKGATVSNYAIDKGLIFISAISLPPLFNQVQLKLNNPILPNTIYHLTVSNVSDCANNPVGNLNKGKIGLPTVARDSELVINEILFNPRSNGFDFVEFYNRSEKIFDLAQLFAANRNSSGAVSSIKQISITPLYIFPGEYFVITEDLTSLELNYLVKDPHVVIEIVSLPSYPDDEGEVILMNSQGSVVDEVKYKDDWHFKLLTNTEGISLERIDPNSASQQPMNWHSAASTAGWATPGYRNSQYKTNEAINASIEISPKVFSPDNDGRDDIAIIQYKLSEPGFVANISIFDAHGRMVRRLVKNATLGFSGSWHWDGLDEKGNKLPIGIYIFYSTVFNLQGKKQDFKNTIVLSRMLN
jgi:hypothetical protein